MKFLQPVTRLFKIKSRLRFRSSLFGLSLIGPAVLLYSVFVVYPLLLGFHISFYIWDGFSDNKIWNGLTNYSAALSDSVFVSALKNTLLFALVVTVVKNIAGLLLALAVSKKRIGRDFFRTVIFLPVVISFVVLGILWSWIFNPSFGLANAFLHLFGVSSYPGWLSDPHLALWTVMWVDIWKWTGFHMVLYLAALQNIPKDYFEAAQIDGGSNSQILRYITLPILRPVVAFNVMISLTGAFVSNYDVVYVMTKGGPFGSTEVALTYIVRKSFDTGLGYANAMSIILFLGTLLFSAIQFRMMTRDQYINVGRIKK